MQIQILNQSTLLTNAQLADTVAALQAQVSNDFGPIYKIEATLTLTSQDNSSIPIYLIDNDASAPPGAVAWHTTDDKDRPYGIVPLDIAIQYGMPIAPVIGHELLELLADPYCNSVVEAVWPYGSKTIAWVAYECCDPVEDDSYTRSVNNVVIPCTNFVLPNWFQAAGKGPVDFLGKLKTPLSLDAGGYAQFYQHGRWSQQFGANAKKFRMETSTHCRRARRERRSREMHA